MSYIYNFLTETKDFYYCNLQLKIHCHIEKFLQQFTTNDVLERDFEPGDIVVYAANNQFQHIALFLGEYNQREYCISKFGIKNKVYLHSKDSVPENYGTASVYRLPEKPLSLLNRISAVLSELADKGLKQKPNRPQSISSSNLITGTQLNSAQIAQLKADLFNLSGIEGWKINPQNHLEAWIEIPNMELATKVVGLLQSQDLAKVLLSRRKDNQTPVIKCSNINLSKLSEHNFGDKNKLSLAYP